MDLSDVFYQICLHEAIIINELNQASFLSPALIVEGKIAPLFTNAD